MIHHIAFPEDWAAALAAGEYRISTRGRTLEQEGYIHCAHADQVAGVLQRFYADVDEPLLRLDIDPVQLTSRVVEEPPAPGMSESFPHIYGPIEVGAVVAAHQLLPPFRP